MNFKYFSPITFRVFIIYFIELLICSTIFGCAIRTFEPPCDKYCKTDEWLFSEAWYSCYSRGIECMRGKCWKYAEDEFLRALKVTPNDTRWAVITYGEHTLPEYFPNRELGITYYNLHDLEDALIYLLKSYKQCPSAKAVYYINRLRQEIYYQKDIGPPRLFLNFKQDVLVTAQSNITISGTAFDDTFVAEITIQVNDKDPLSLIELSEPIVKEFEQKVSLKVGVNEVLIRVCDLFGNKKEYKINIFVDQEGPMIYFTKIKGESITPQYSFEGIIYDLSDVKYFSLNGNKVTLTKIEASNDPNINIIQYKAYYFCYHISSKEKEKGILHYSAKDSFNNSTSGSVTINEESRQEEKKQVAYLDNGYVQSAMSHQVIISSSDVKAPLYQIGGKKDLNSILITVTQLPKETFQAEVYPQIEIRFNCKIRQILINDRPVLSYYGIKWGEIFSSIIRKYLKNEQEGSIVFPRMIGLEQVGENIITIKVEDEFGIQWEKLIKVIRKERQIDKLNERWRITIPYIVHDLEENEEKKSKKLTYKLVEAFRIQKRFNIIEYENLPKIIQEKKLHYYLGSPYLGLPKESEIWIDAILFGNVQITDNSFDLSTSLVDLETGEILATKDVFEKINPIDPLYYTWQEKKWEHIFENCNILAARLKEYFPLCEGHVTDLTKEEIGISICKSDGLKKGMKLIIYEKLKKNEGFIIIGEAKVKEVQESFSIAKPLEEIEIINNVNIFMNYAVITK